MQDIQTFEGDERRYVLLLDVRYGIFFNRLQSRVYRHILTALGFAQVVAGSAAVVSVVAAIPPLAASAGVVMAALGAVSALIDVGGRSARFDEHARAYGELDAEAAELAIDVLATRLSRLQMTPPEGEIDALANPAYNANLIANGRGDAVVHLSLLECAFAACA